MTATHAHQVAELGTLAEILPGIHLLTQPDWGWGLNNSGVIVGDDSVLVVDTCFTERRTRRLLAEIERVTDKPVQYVVNTHHHGDHTFGNYVFSNAVVVGHEACRRKVLSEGLAVLPYFSTVEWGEIRITPPSLCFDDRLTINLGDLEVQLISVAPAHTVGDVVVWLPDQKVLFAGDIVMNGCTPVITDGSLAGTRKALELVRALAPSVVVAGHGAPTDASIFDEVSAYFDLVEQAATAGYAKGLTPLEVARTVDLGKYAEWTDSERIVANIARTYSELRGEPLGTPLQRKEIAPMMTEFAGHPLRCHA
ncbi:MBL fold metallo-hydrolase [Nocardia sp. NBC_01499]|uniref:MBL fold metallo-hydrolase n=1 Tax=Nocardia sp. NBC_01499 TaxID=2903597 RepID=UPI00386CFB7D